MVSALNDLYLLKMFSTADTHVGEFLNAFWFELMDWGSATPGQAVASRLNIEFGVSVSNFIATMLQVDTDILRIESVNYNNPVDFATTVGSAGLPRTGDRVGSVCPANLTLSFRYVRANPGLRSGWKRFGLLSETDVAGDAITAALKTVIDTAVPKLLDDIVATGDTTFRVVVATGAKVLGVNPTSFVPADVEYAGLGSQNSRKPPLLPTVI